MTIPTIRNSTKDIIYIEKNNFKSLLEKLEKETKLKVDNEKNIIATRQSFFPKVNKALSNKSIRKNNA